jgi:putative phosphoesterase
MSSPAFRVGLISDTHGLLRVEVLAALAGADAILHAGDIGDPAILDQLSLIAPVTAVRGNNDRDACYAQIPERAQVEFGGVAIELLHDLSELVPGNHRVVVSGHSHRPKAETRDHVLYVNPGSAGPRRFRLPVSMGWLLIDDHGLRAELVTLEV